MPLTMVLESKEGRKVQEEMKEEGKEDMKIGQGSNKEDIKKKQKWKKEKR